MAWGRIGSAGHRWSLVAGGVCALGAALLSATDLVERWELRTQDLRFAHRGPRATRARIVIAAIGDETLQAWPEAMERWGGRFAAAIEQTRGFGAAWIGLDLIPAVSTDPGSTQRFATALAGGRVVLANARPTGREPVNPMAALVFAHPEQPSNLGFIHLRPELDDVVRHGTVYEKDADGLLPSFPAVLALRTRGQSPEDADALRALAGNASANEGAIRINFVGPPGAFPYLPIEQLAAGTLTRAQRDRIRGAVLLIGATYSGSNDLQRGAGGRFYNGVEIHAHTVATLLDQRPLRRGTGLGEVLIVVAVGLLVAGITSALPFTWGLVLVVALGVGWWRLSLHTFAMDWLLPTAGPWLAMGLAWAGHHAGRSVEEAARRRWIEGVFGRYVSPEIVTYLLRHPEHLKLGGVEREVTILFLDIRGYSTFAQGRPPAEVMGALNAFFADVAPVIDRHQGLIIEYTGDGLLAAFGAAKPVTNHAQAAVNAAIEIARVSRSRSVAHVFRVGCGIHTGMAVCGNLGWAKRSEYHVVGDTVNVASRVQDLNKAPELNTEFPSEVLISQATYERLERLPLLRGPFPFPIRGREGQLDLYQVRIGDE